MLSKTLLTLHEQETFKVMPALGTSICQGLKSLATSP
jgi:hypothetical protein